MSKHRYTLATHDASLQLITFTYYLNLYSTYDNMETPYRGNESSETCRQTKTRQSEHLSKENSRVLSQHGTHQQLSLS